MSAARARPLGVRLKVAGQVPETHLPAADVDEVVDAVAVGDQQPVELAEQLACGGPRAGRVDPVARRGRRQGAPQPQALPGPRPARLISVRDIRCLDRPPDRVPRHRERLGRLLEDVVDRSEADPRAEHVPHQSERRAAGHQHRGEHHDRRPEPRPECARLNPGRYLGSCVRPATRTRHLHKLILGRDHRTLRQLDHLMNNRTTNHPAIAVPGQLPAALAAALRPAQGSSHQARQPPHATRPDARADRPAYAPNASAADASACPEGPSTTAASC